MRRFVHWATIVVGLTVLVQGQLSAQEAGERSGRPVVAIMDFTNSSLVDHAAYEPLRVGISGMLLAELQQNQEIELIERERLHQVLDELELGGSGQVDPATAARAGNLLGAHHIIFGVFVIDLRDNLRIDARAVSVETSRVEHVETVTDDADNLLGAVQRLGQQLSSGLDLPSAEAAPPERDERSAGRLDVRVNLKYARAMLAEDRGNSAEALRLYREFLTELPAGRAPALRAAVEERVRILTIEQL